jgi:glycosyltransferase involved in cell wall biosynthesis
VKADVVGRMGFPEERVDVIFNAIQVATYTPATRPFDRAGQQIVVGSASRLAPEKNHESLIQGFALARRTTPGLILRLAGTGPLAPRLAAVVAEQQLTDCVELLGHVEDVRGFFESLDLYVQPSRTEGLPCAVIEAMAMKRPVVATDVPGNRDAVVHGSTGWLIAPNSPEAWANAISEALRDRPRAIALGEAGRRRAEELFDSEAMVTKTLHLLKRLEGFPCP